MDPLNQNQRPAGVNSRVSSGVESTAARKKEMEEKKLKKACTDFEAFFIYYMLKTMRETVPSSDFPGKTPGKDSYTMMLDQKIAESAASRGNGLGLQKMIFNELNKIKR